MCSYAAKNQEKLHTNWYSNGIDSRIAAATQIILSYSSGGASVFPGSHANFRPKRRLDRFIRFAALTDWCA